MNENSETTDQLKIAKLGKNDLQRFMELIGLFEKVFEMKDFSMPSSSHLQELLNRSNFLVFAAVLDNKVVGGLTAYVLEQYYLEMPQAYMYDLAVATNMQRRGIGRKLIAATNAFCREKGFEEVFVQADMADAHALDFYRAMKPTKELQAVHFSYVLNTK